MTIYDNMVHYDPLNAAHQPPPICPKCGSHRTEVVGITDTPPALIVRCSACGARSTLPMDEKETAEKTTMDDVTVELEVIQSVGRALARLSDADAQARVIRWINDRFQQSSASKPANATVNGPRPGRFTPALDAALGVDELEDFFERPGATPVMHRESVAEREPAAPQQEVGIDSLVRGFVSDFQRVALEWQGA